MIPSQNGTSKSKFKCFLGGGDSIGNAPLGASAPAAGTSTARSSFQTGSKRELLPMHGCLYDCSFLSILGGICFVVVDAREISDGHIIDILLPIVFSGRSWGRRSSVLFSWFDPQPLQVVLAIGRVSIWINGRILRPMYLGTNAEENNCEKEKPMTAFRHAQRLHTPIVQRGRSENALNGHGT